MADEIKAFERAFDKRLKKDFVQNLKSTPRELTEEELKNRIIRFLDDHCICTLATCSDNIPRSTILRYRNRGLTIYFFTEGGGKVKNLKVNPKVSVSVCGEYTGFQSVCCLQAWGTAAILNPREEEYRELKTFFNLSQREDVKKAGIKDVPDMFLIRIDLTRMRFLSFPEAILNQELQVG